MSGITYLWPAVGERGVGGKVLGQRGEGTRAEPGEGGGTNLSSVFFTKMIPSGFVGLNCEPSAGGRCGLNSACVGVAVSVSFSLNVTRTNRSLIDAS